MIFRAIMATIKMAIGKIEVMEKSLSMRATLSFDRQFASAGVIKNAMK